MDIVLELWDTFIGDRMYAELLPASLISSITLPAAFNDANSTLSFFGKPDSYVYEPATYLFRTEPSKYAYMSAWPRDNIYRQTVSFFLITWIFGIIVYFICATLSYIFIWDSTTIKHPKWLKNQIRMEIAQTMKAMPIMSLLTVPFFVAEARGYSKLYDTSAEAPFPYYSILQFPIFIAFTDFFIYWIHRGLHHRLIYKLHKPHHKWIMPSPFASHAFHPVDGWSQSLPYHIFPFVLPLQKWAYVVLFAFINFWTVMIHDGEYVSDSPVVNGAACHTMHHLYFNYNYGQFTTLWDRLGGSYRKPNEELFRRETKMGKAEWSRQTREMEAILLTVEGTDDRVYLNESSNKKNL